MTHFLGIDLGASALKACVIDAAGKSVAVARVPIATHNPKPGHSEQRPEDWRIALRLALSELKETAAEIYANITAISFSGGAHIGVLCNGEAEPLRPAILWNDQRAAEEANMLQDNATVFERTGNQPNPTWTLPQLIWLHRHEPEIIQNTAKLFFAKDWLAAQLTGHHVTDKTEAVGSLMAGRTGAWDGELVALSGLSPDALPKIVAIGAAIGTLTAEAATAFDLPQVPVYQGAIDTSMEWLCAAPLNEKTTSLKLASAGVVSITTTQTKRLAPISYYPHIIDGLSYHAAGMSDCMGAIEFIRENLTPGLDAKAFERAAATAPAGAEGLLFYPYLSGARAPFWDAHLTATLQGLTRGHGQAAIARAAYEGVGHVLTAIIDDMGAALNSRPDSAHILGGGGNSDFFCQLLADMMDITLHRGQETDCAFATAIFAAAAHSGRALGETALAAYSPNAIFTPDKTNSAVYGSTQKAFMARHK